MSSEIQNIDLRDKQFSIKARNPFESFSYLRAMEESNCASEESGWIPDHLGETKNEKLLSFIPLYKKLNSYGEFIFDQQWANALQRTGRKYYPKFLTAIPFTPCEGDRIFAETRHEKFKLIDAVINKMKEEEVELTTSTRASSGSSAAAAARADMVLGPSEAVRIGRKT